MDALLTAILNDDRPKVKALLKLDHALATRLVDKPKLYRSKIHHWIYAGDTALHLAAAGYRVEIMELLLAAGADPNAAMNHRRSGPLHYAADGYVISPDWDAKRQVKTIRCLLDAGADIHAQDKNERHSLAPRGKDAMCRGREVFAASLRDTQRKNKPGSTPFHLAVQNTGRGGSGADVAKIAQREIIAEFLSFGVSMGLKDGKGKSVLECATSDWIRSMLRADGTARESG